jgi:hypothetical protein
MTHDEMERAIAFVLEQQAKFDARLLEHGERMAARMLELVQTQERFQNSLGLMREALVGTMGLVQKLTEAQEATDRRLNALAQRTDEIGARLDAFIVVVERYITRNGGKG